MRVIISDKAAMAIDALSVEDRERVLRAIRQFETDSIAWIRRNSHKLGNIATSDGQQVWILKVGLYLRLLYCYLPDDAIVVLDVALHDRIDRLLPRPGGSL